jgi:hypothetical protein
MIPTKTRELDVTSTLEGREIGMTIDENSLQHIMAVLTDLYSDPLLAIVREYSTNARDAHIAAGKDDDPIEVYTPTALSPSLRIIDHGVGLSADDIENIYSKYGASTKTHSNDFNGVLGLGCKSALTYTSQFTVVGTKDGVRTTVSVSRDEEGVGTMTVLDQVDVYDDDGVEIQIAIKQDDRHSLLEKAEEFFRYWEPGTVLLNNKEPEYLEGMQIGEHLTLERVENRWDAQNLLVMGGVAYPIEQSSFQLPDYYRIVARVPNGAVHFTPSREALNYTTRTKEVITQLVATFKADLEDSVTKEIEAQPTKHDAVQAAVRWISVLPTHLRGSKFTYKGLELPAEVSVDGGASNTWIVSKGKEEKDWLGKRQRVGAHSRVSSMSISSIPDCIFVTDFMRTFTPTVKHKLWEWCDQNGRDKPEHFVMTGAAPTSPWIDPSQIISWPNDVEPIKLPRYQNMTRTPGITTRRLKGSYDLYTNDADGRKVMTEVEADDIAAMDKPIYYYEAGKGGAGSWARTLGKLVDDYVLVYFTQRRTNKFLRSFPDAQPVQPFIREGCDFIASQFTEVEKQVIAYHRGHGRNAHGWLSWTVQDPELRRILVLRDYPKERRDWLVDTWRLLQSHGSNCVLPELGNPMSKYPLARNHCGDRQSLSTKHVLLYINMIYQMEQSANA